MEIMKQIKIGFAIQSVYPPLKYQIRRILISKEETEDDLYDFPVGHPVTLVRSATAAFAKAEKELQSAIDNCHSKHLYYSSRDGIHYAKTLSVGQSWSISLA